MNRNGSGPVNGEDGEADVPCERIDEVAEREVQIVIAHKIHIRARNRLAVGGENDGFEIAGEFHVKGKSSEGIEDACRTQRRSDTGTGEQGGIILFDLPEGDGSGIARVCRCEGTRTVVF